MATDAAVVVESSPTQVLKDLTPAQHKTWRATGELPEKKAPEAKESKEAPQSTEAASSPAAKEVAAPEAEKPAAEVPAKSASAETEPKAKPKAGAEARIADLLAENRKLNQELESLRKQPVAAPAKIEEVAKPRRNDVDPKTGQALYATDEAFEEAHERYLTAKVTKDVETRHANAERERRVAEQNRINEQRMANSVKITTEKHPDFLDVLKAKTVEKDGKKITVFEADAVKAIKTNGVLDAWIMESEIGMEILYHLAKNPAEVDRIQALNPFAAARELTKLEDKLSAAAASKETPAESSPATKKISGAPAPADSVNGKATAPVDEVAAAVGAGDFKRFKAAADAEDYRKRKAS
jgi:Micro-tubular organiser Mto1 C-term Mto2-binding region